MKKIILLLLILFISTPVLATTWYVRPSGAGLKDGTSYANAYDGFADITWGAGGVVAGDMLYVAGTFTVADLTVGAAGTSGNRITIRGDYTGDPGQIGNVSTAREVCVNNYLTLSSLTVYGRIRKCIDNYYNSSAGIQFIASTNEIRDTSKGLISGGFTTSDQFKVADAVTNNAVVFGVNSVSDQGTYERIIVDTTGAMRSIQDEASGEYALYKFKKLTDITVDNCKVVAIAESSLDPLDLGGISNLIISNSEVDGGGFSTNGAFYTDINDSWTRPSNIVLESNYFHDIGNTVSFAYDSHCIGLQAVNGMTIKGNHLKNCAAGIVVYPGATAATKIDDLEISRNYIEGMNTALHDTQFPGCGIAFSGDDQCPLCDPATVAYNIITTPLNCPGNVDSTCMGIGGKWSVQNKVHNNTLIANDINMYHGTSGTSMDIRNNISYNPNTYHIYLNTTLGTWTEDYNFYSPNTGTKFYHGGAHNFADYQSGHPDVATRSVTHLYVTDPAPSTTTGMIPSTSLAVDAGVALGYSTDKFGNGVGASPDIGAHEYRTTPVGKIGSGSVGTIGSGAVLTIN